MQQWIFLILPLLLFLNPQSNAFDSDLYKKIDWKQKHYNYSHLHPYHFKYCGSTRYQKINHEDRSKDIYGLISGHATFYLNGVKKVLTPIEGRDVFTLEMIDTDTLMKNPYNQGLGFSIDVIYKRPSFLMTDGFEDLVYSPLDKDEELNEEAYQKLLHTLVDKGTFDNAVIDTDVLDTNLSLTQKITGIPLIKNPNHILNYEEKLKIADYVLGTDIYLNAARGKVYCVVIPLSKKSAEKLKDSINEEIYKPQGGEKAPVGGPLCYYKKQDNFYNYSLADHCGVFPRNLLAELGLVKKQERCVSTFELIFQETFPADTIVDTLNSPKLKHLLKKGDAYLEVIPMHEKNTVFEKNLSIHGYSLIDWIFGTRASELLNFEEKFLK